jgi:hypothetical protein
MQTVVPFLISLSDVEVSVVDQTLTAPSTSGRSKLLSRKKSISFVSPLPTTPAVRKEKVFFSKEVDYNSSTNTTTAEDAARGGSWDNKKMPSPMPSAPSNSFTRSCFVLNFGDHSYQIYGICLKFPVTFHDVTNDVLVKSAYVICFMSTFSLFSYLFNILDHLEMKSNFLQFPEPLPEWKESDRGRNVEKLHRSLRPLQELAMQLSRVRPPHYPHLGCFDTNASKDFSVEEMIALNRNSDIYRFEVVSVLPDIAFNFAFNKSNVDIDDMGNVQAQREFVFRRRQYQSLYSNFSIDYGNLTKVDEMMLKCNENADSSAFTVNRDQKIERENENHTLALLWALPTLLKFFKLDQITLALGCIVSEMKIIVLHKDIQVVSAVIFALLNLINPLKWYGQVIITVPDSLSDLLGKSFYSNYDCYMFSFLIDYFLSFFLRV